MNISTRVAIIGGGISGLATAWWLRQAGIDALVLEREQIPGGTMQTIRDGEWLMELGPNSALETTPLFKQLFTEVGIADEVLNANQFANRRYILRNGKLHPLPSGPGGFFASKLWSLAGKLRLLGEPFAGRASREETIAEFVERRLGREFLDYAIDPFVAGVYAGNPSSLSVRAAFPKLYALEAKYGGLIVGTLKSARERKNRAEKSKDRAGMISFQHGMAVFPKAIAAKLGDKFIAGISIESIARTTDAAKLKYVLSGMRGGEGFTCEADAVLTAVPSYVTAPLIEGFDPSLAKLLNEIYYPAVAEVFIGFKESDISRPLDGFGFLVPAKEQRKILGCIWSSTLFPNRSPKGFAALTVFVGGSRNPEVMKLNDDELKAVVCDELKLIMGIRGAPVFARISRWSKAIPQYNLGHLAIIEQVEQFERANRGMFLSGNFRGGISVGDCILSSDRTANAIKTFLNHK
jgi:oxygen-dependent protoporphyrinogen oxidase